MHHRGIANRHKVRFRKYGTQISIPGSKEKEFQGCYHKEPGEDQGWRGSILSREEEFLSILYAICERDVIPVLKIALIGLPW